jgi:hypothetical protein
MTTQYKMLPSEPTQEMLEAEQFASSLAYESHEIQAVEVYKAMWQAAPEVEPVQTLEELEQEIYENTQAFIPHNVMQWMLKRYRNHTPEVQQEPVESQFYDEGNDKWYSFMSEEHKRATIEAGYKVRDLYSHQQPKREPLSEDEIMRIVNAHEGDTIGVVRAIEQAHGIGVE